MGYEPEVEDNHLEILNALYEIESHVLNQIETVRCMVRDLGTEVPSKKRQTCDICSDKRFYHDISGLWFKCPKCNP